MSQASIRREGGKKKPKGGKKLAQKHSVSRPYADTLKTPCALALKAFAADSPSETQTAQQQYLSEKPRGKRGGRNPLSILACLGIKRKENTVNTLITSHSLESGSEKEK